MKLINWAIGNPSKNIAIIAKTAVQADHILKAIKTNIFMNNPSGLTLHTFAPAGRGELRFDNGTKIMIAAEHSSADRFRGMTIDVLLFCENMGTNTINVIKRHLLPQMRAETRTIGVLRHE